MTEKALVALSGGVDSAVAAALVKESGYEVTGIMMKIYGGEESAVDAHSKHGCYGPGEAADIEDARKVADKLGIRFEVFDLTREYKTSILEHFKAEYCAGRTPNPCVHCNQRIKLGVLIDKARSSGLDFDSVATGHYARVRYDPSSGRYQLLRAIDHSKDQSYFLARLSQAQLKTVRFPLGELPKEEVRGLAERYGLSVAEKPESQNFIAGGYHQLVIQGVAEGPILDEIGERLGTHPGVAFFTMGQRHGLGLSGTEPRYVTAIDPIRNAIIVGGRDSLFHTAVLVEDLNWISVDHLDFGMEVTAKIRSGCSLVKAWIEPFGANQVKIIFENPQMAPAPGQTAVFYTGDVVLGSGIIEKALC
ncbi:MAG: tRNA 2-thiouridine(34) synthase MnmA [Dehalogenimonas sp.]